MTENVVSVDSDERYGDKGHHQHQHPTYKATTLITAMKKTPDRKRKWSNYDHCQCQSFCDGSRCEKSIHAAAERPSAVSTSPVVIATPSSAAAVVRATCCPPQPTHDEPESQVPDGRPPTDSRCSDNDDKLSRLPVGVVSVWHKNWSNVGAPRLLVEPSLCRESFLPVILLNGSGCCQLSN